MLPKIEQNPITAAKNFWKPSNFGEDLNPNKIVSSRNVIKTILLSSLILVLSMMFFFKITHGGQAFTSESLRRAEIEDSPKLLPNFLLIDSNGNQISLSELLGKSQVPNGITIVDFIYTRCQTVCLALGNNYQQLQKKIQEEGLENQVKLLSISFDPEFDTPQLLEAYAHKMAADSKIWTITGLKNKQDRMKLLDAFGIIVIKAPLDEFEHNAAFHLVDSNNRLLEIIDIDQIDEVLHRALRIQANARTYVN